MGEYPTSGIERDPARATDETIVIPGHGPIGNKSQLIIFGNARGGTPLMQSAQTVGIDLPLKTLVWQDAAPQTWISYNQPEWIAQRHGVANAEETVTKMADLFNAISRTAGDPEP
jgi:uncharacterized protein (DUF302 family)